MFLGSGKLLEWTSECSSFISCETQISIKEVVLTAVVCSGQCLDRLPAHSAVSG